MSTETLSQPLDQPPSQRSRRRHRAATGVLFGVVALMLSACTVQSGGHYQVDLVAGPGYHFHIYQTPTAQVWGYHRLFCKGDANCTLQFLKGQVQVNGIAGAVSGIDKFFDADQAGDFIGALNDATPANASVNAPGRFGCLSGYRNLVPWYDPDWYSASFNGDYCRLGQKVS